MDLSVKLTVVEPRGAAVEGNRHLAVAVAFPSVQTCTSEPGAGELG